MNQNFVDKLKAGEVIQFRPRGNSMKPKINSGNLVTISPDVSELKPDDMVFCKVKGRFYVHLIQSISQKMGGRRFQIGNNKGHTNGTIGEQAVFGKVVRVES